MYPIQVGCYGDSNLDLTQPQATPRFISKPWRKIGRRPGTNTTSQIVNSGLSFVMMAKCLRNMRPVQQAIVDVWPTAQTLLPSHQVTQWPSSLRPSCQRSSQSRYQAGMFDGGKGEDREGREKRGKKTRQNAFQKCSQHLKSWSELRCCWLLACQLLLQA